MKPSEITKEDLKVDNLEIEAKKKEIKKRMGVSEEEFDVVASVSVDIMESFQLEFFNMLKKYADKINETQLFDDITKCSALSACLVTIKLGIENILKGMENG